MRAILFKTVWRCACALTISGGAYGQPGPAAPQADQALPSSPVAAQPAKPKPVQTRSARSSGSAANISAAVPATAPPKPPTNMPVKPDRSPSAATPASGTGSVNPENAGSGPDTTSSFDNLEIVDAGLKGELAVLRLGSQP